MAAVLWISCEAYGPRGMLLVYHRMNLNSENGLANRSCTPLEKGDVIVPLYGTDGEAAGEENTVPAEGLTIDYEALPVGTYLYAFNITDVFGDRYVTDQVQFDVEEDGIYFVA